MDLSAPIGALKSAWARHSIQKRVIVLIVLPAFALVVRTCAAGFGPSMVWLAWFCSSSMLFVVAVVLGAYGWAEPRKRRSRYAAMLIALAAIAFNWSVVFWNVPLKAVFLIHGETFDSLSRRAMAVKGSSLGPVSVGPLRFRAVTAHGNSVWFERAGCGGNWDGFLYAPDDTADGHLNLWAANRINHGWFVVEED